MNQIESNCEAIVAKQSDTKKITVIKRDGRKEKFSIDKIWTAIGKSVAETGAFDEVETKRLTDIVVTIVTRTHAEHPASVEQVQDVVEQVLMAAGYYETAKAYILYRAERTKLRAAKKQLGVTDDLGLSLNQLKVIERRYLLHNQQGEVIETPKEWLTRVATTLAKAEKKNQGKWKQRFFEVMASFEFLPAGRTLNNAGTKQNQLANCFVLPVGDSMGEIFDAVKWTALVHQTGGGTGFNFSALRPSGDAVSKSAGGYATGPVSFMKVFDVATRQVMQGGKKRGANMGILNVDHPDILEFINCKTEDGEIANFNISVGINDTFMKAVRDDGMFGLRNPRTGEVVQEVRARMLMDQIATLAWRTGDPGMINLSAINRNNPLLDAYGLIDATNPCGEQPLHPFDACNLGSINLAAFATQNDNLIDWERLGTVVQVGVRMLDNVIDVCSYPISEIGETVRANRRIGLGVMGWADLLFALGIGYNTQEAVELAEKVMKFIQTKSWEYSEKLAAEKGVFPRWNESAFADGWDPIKQKRGKHEWKVRNVAITTIAPTGTISMAASTSSGIEPVFALSFVKHVVDEAGLVYINPYFRKALVEAGVVGEQLDIVTTRLGRGESLAQIEIVPQTLRKLFVTAHDVEWQWHVKMQAAFQKYTDNAVSKTINFPKSASIDDIKGAYMLAWELGCKGITVYRDASKSFQVLGHQTDSHKKAGKKDQDYIIQSKIVTKSLQERMSEVGLVLGGERPACPECGGVVAIQEGCSLCHGCGWSACTS